MPRFRFVPRPQCAAPARPFASAAEAWFWYVRCRKARRDGARFEAAGSSWQRPCDPDDVQRVLNRLYRRGAVAKIHLATLARFGAAERAPDPRCEDELIFVGPWDEALDRLATPLKEKGIVA